MSHRDVVMMSSPKVRFTKGSEPLNNLQANKFTSNRPKAVPVIKSSVPVNLRVDVLGENGKCVMKIKPNVQRKVVVVKESQKSVAKKPPVIDLDGNRENFIQNSQDPDIMFLEEVKTPRVPISFVSPKKVSREKNSTRVINPLSRKSMPAVLPSDHLKKPQQNSINCTKKKLKEIIELDCEAKAKDLPQSNRKSLKNKVWINFFSLIFIKFFFLLLDKHWYLFLLHINFLHSWCFQISAAREFPLDEAIYNNLIDLSIDKDQLPSRVTRTKDPKPCKKDIVPRLADYYERRTGSEHCVAVDVPASNSVKAFLLNSFPISSRIEHWNDLVDYNYWDKVLLPYGDVDCSISCC